MKRLLPLLALWQTAPAAAATFDPELTWRTLQTEHFNIHFHQGIEPVAEAFSLMVDEVYETMTAELQWTPRRRTELVLVDRTDQANGYASVVPYNQIVIYPTAPTADSTLNLYEDWNEAIFTHELAHVLHLDTHHGLVSLARAVVGKIASTNDLSPSWMIEGLATFQETRQTPGGRGRAAWPDMIKRTAVVEGNFPPLGNLDGYQPEPPAGNLRYLFGQDFMQYVADHTGEDVWTRWTHTYGSGLPYLLPSRRVFGKRLVPLYKEWREHLFDHYGRQAEAVREEGETVGRLASDPEASCVAPAFSPNGEHLVWSCYDLREGSSIWMADGQGYARERLLQDRGASDFTWRNDSGAFVYAGSRIVNQFNVWSDIYMHTLGSEGITALTHGARARDPEFSPDGTRLLYVTQSAQQNHLEVMTVDRQRRALTEAGDGVQLSTPRYAPSGEVLAVSVWRDGQRDLWLYDKDGQPIRRLTADHAIDSNPEWSPDGRWLFFSSDRSGIYNIYAIDMQTERLWQVTHVVTGAIKPSVHPTGSLLAYQQYGRMGWQIRLLDLDPARWIDRGLLPRPLRYDQPLSSISSMARSSDPQEEATVGRWEEPSGEEGPLGRRRGGPFAPLALSQSAEVVDTFDDTHVRDAFGEERDFPFTLTPRRYNPLPTLLPRYILPTIQTTPQFPGPTFAGLPLKRGLQGTLSSSASDALRHAAWTAHLSYRTDAEFLGGGATFTWNRFIPVFTIGASTRAVASGRLFFYDPSAPVPTEGLPELFSYEARDPRSVYWERRITSYAQVSWPYKLRSTLFARYSLTDRQPLTELNDEVYLPLVPLRGRVGSVSGGWRYSWAQQTPYAISREDARIFSLVGSLLAPWLGTSVLDEHDESVPLTQVQLTTEIREYLVNPLIPNHVLALRGATGITLGGAHRFLGNYQLGGSIGDSAFYVTPDAFRMVRGYPLASSIGDMYWLSGIEYRFPIWQIHRGVGTLPAFARTLSGSLFADAGRAFNSPAARGEIPSSDWLIREAFTEPLVGVGAELGFSAIVGYGVGLSGRLGYGVGLTGDGFKPDDPRTLYLQLGGSF